MDGPIVSLPAAVPETSAPVIAVGEAALRPDVLSLFMQLLPAEFFREALRQAGVRENNRVYTSAVVIWLMIMQRLQGNGTLESAVLELLRGLDTSFWPRPCKLLKEAAVEGGPKLSKHTGAFNNARQELSRPVVEDCCDEAFEQLVQQSAEAAGHTRRPAFFLDGTAIRMPHSEPLMEVYPPSGNQHGPSHWPVIRMLVAHDAYTGMAMRPEWGPINGPRRVSEQGLLEQAIHRLPGEAVVMGDSNFGVFSVAYAAVRRGHPVVLRLTAVRARHLSGGPWRDGIDQRIVWRPSREDRKSHPELPAEACVEGRLIIRQVEPSHGAPAFLLALFTTLPDPPEEIVNLYGYRWYIEGDLRTLKGTLQLEDLTCTTPDMVAKEIDVAMLTYNLVRAVMYLIAQKAGLEPRSFSFTQVRNVLHAFLPRISAAQDERQARKLYEDMMYYLGQCKLPRRQRPSYARAVWPKPKSYPARHA